MVLKLIGGTLLAAAGFAMGCMLSKNLYARRNFLNSFIVFLSALSTNIRYNSSDIFTAVNQSARTEESDYFKFDETNIDLPFEQQWGERINSLPKNLALKHSDKELLLEFGSELGKTDIDGQLKHIELYKAMFANQLSNSEDEIAKKSKLYKTMGLFVGVSAALMMI